MFRLSLPTIASMLTIGLYYVADAAFVSRLGTAQLAAVSVAFPVFAVVGGIGQIFGTGAASWISRLLGGGDREQADGAASVALCSAALVALFIATAGQLVLPALIRLLGASEAVYPYALSYVRIIIPANSVTILNVTMASIVRSEGNARRAMYSVAVSQFLNIALDPVMIFLFGLGIRGAAFATLVSQTASFVYLAATFVRRDNNCAVSVTAALRHRRLLRRIIVVGIPSLSLQFLGSFALALTNNAASQFGDAAIASVGVGFRVLAFGVYPVYGLSIGLQPIAGYSHGAGRFDRLTAALKETIKWAGAYAVIFAVVVVVWAPQIVGFFSPDPAVVAIGGRLLRTVTVMFPFFSLQVVFAVLFQAVGRPIPAAAIFVARQAVFFIPAVLVLPRLFGLTGLIFSQPFADALTTMLTAVLAVRFLRPLTFGCAALTKHIE